MLKSRWWLGAVVVALLAGCSADEPLNPSFPLTMDEAKAALREMAAEPKPLERPVLVLCGLYDPGFAAHGLTSRLREVTTGEQPILMISFFGTRSFDQCADRVLGRVSEQIPNEEGDEHPEVDVVAVSMGGLVARHAAREREGASGPLRIRRLFTISSPHNGARLAGLPTLDDRILSMRRGSEFLAELDAILPEADYELVPYTRLDDGIVGASNAAPPGMHPWWVANPPLELAHLTVHGDERIIADIARRLRGEPPYTTGPARPVPTGTKPKDES